MSIKELRSGFAMGQDDEGRDHALCAGFTSGQWRILIVDDEELNRSVLGGLVRGLGHMPLLAANGRDALALLDRTVDLVLLDVMMPGMNGYQVAETIRAGDRASDVPIIMCTTLDGRGDRLRAIQAGADGYLVKPVGCAQLRAKLEITLGRRRPHWEAPGP